MTCRPNVSVEWKSLLPLWWRVSFCFGRHLGSGHSISHFIVSAWSISNASLMGKGFRAEKRSVQASVHPSSRAQGGLFCVLTLFVCVVLGEFWLRLNEIHEVRTFAPYKAFFLCFFSSLENYMDSQQPMLKEKQIIPSVWGGIKSFEHFQTVRVKDRMSLRNGMWIGLRNDIIMRNEIYAEWIN